MSEPAVANNLRTYASSGTIAPEPSRPFHAMFFAPAVEKTSVISLTIGPPLSGKTRSATVAGADSVKPMLVVSLTMGLKLALENVTAVRVSRLSVTVAVAVAEFADDIRGAQTQCVWAWRRGRRCRLRN